MFRSAPRRRFGSNTLPITCMTPFEASMSAVPTFASLMYTAPFRAWITMPRPFTLFGKAPGTCPVRVASK